MLVLLFIGMTAFLTESCHGDSAHEQQSFLNTAKRRCEVPSVWYYTCVPAEIGG